MTKAQFTPVVAALIIGASIGYAMKPDDNAKATYGDSGLPRNCRAYVQAAVDGWATRQYSAEDTMAGLERNCGTEGQSWKDHR